MTAIALYVGVSLVVLADVEVPVVLALGPLPVAEAAVPLREPESSKPGPLPAVSPALLSNLSSRKKVVALTFDDGPDPVSTGQVLDVLKKYKVSATFCMIGRQAMARPDLVRRVVAEGHRLCNHTFTHDARIGTRAAGLMDRQLRAGRDALVRAGGKRAAVGYFRAPEGKWTRALERMSARDGMRPLGWSVDTKDWTRPGSAAIIDTVKRAVRPGSVVLFHDGGGPRGQTLSSLRTLIPWLQGQGYGFALPG